MGQKKLDLDKVVEFGLLPVIRKRDIMQIRLLSKEEKLKIARGSADVLGTTPTGQQVLIDRRTLAQNYTLLNGKKISIAGLSASRSYMVMRYDNTPAYAMAVPLNYTFDVNGKKVNATKRNKGDYIVCLADSNGGIDKSTAGVVTAAMFKKMFTMPPNDVIKHSKTGRKADRKRDTQSNVGINQSVNKDNKQYAKQSNEQNNASNISEALNGEKTEVIRHENEQATYKYVAIATLINETGSIVGFIIQNKAGKTMNVNKLQMVELCRRKEASNLVLMRKHDTGTEYLRGKNMSIEMLPKHRI